MLAGFDLGSSDNGMQAVFEQIEALRVAGGDPEGLDSLRTKLQDSASLLQHASQAEEGERVLELEDRLAALQEEQEALLCRNLTSSDVEEIKQKLEGLYVDRRETQTDIIHDLRDELTHKTEEIHRLRQNMSDLQTRNSTNGVPNGVTNRSLQQQIADFDLMKKNLMHDLQNRCERVVELEISLDETREQYNNVLRSSNNRQQQKKMAFLERNLEQLTVVQRQLVEQNTSLKKEVAIAERKLIARNERILSLESLLSDSQEKLTAANHRYDQRPSVKIPLTCHSFETQLQAVKERLEAAKISRNLGAPPTNGTSLANLGARIAKPLRGGGAATEMDGGLSHPVLSNLVRSDSTSGKRSSWFFNTNR